jgi:hypothetical protein
MVTDLYELTPEEIALVEGEKETVQLWGRSFSKCFPTHDKPDFDNRGLEAKVDRMVNDLYELTPKEIALVEGRK